MLVPGVMLVFALYPLVQVIDPTLEWQGIFSAFDLEKGTYLFIAIALGIAYNYTHLREFSNRRYHQKVNVNLRLQALRALPEQERNLDLYRWKDVRSIFFSLC
jgi:hypothetical protein